jgi:hypothetical protein
LDDQELVVAKLESYAEFHEDEDEDSSFQVCSLVSSINDDEVWQEETQVNYQQETSSFLYPNSCSRRT